MRRIGIIGCGQLGSRHLQAMKSVKEELSIFVFDPSQNSLSTAKERYEGIEGQTHKVEYFTEMSIDEEYEVVIIATSSGVRFSVMKKFLEQNKVKFLILEKLLFSKIDDYTKALRLLAENYVKAWVNCPMRINPTYIKAKAKLGKVITYNVVGSDYGLVTNAIHYIDHMVDLIGSADFEVDSSSIAPELIYSKRNGYHELYGTLIFKFGNGSIGTISCFKGGTLPVRVEISSDSYSIISMEGDQKAIEYDNAWKETETNMPFQSEMTGWIVKNLLSKGECGLTPFSESSEIHIKLLKSLETVLEANGKDGKIYPFT